MEGRASQGGRMGERKGLRRVEAGGKGKPRGKKPRSTRLCGALVSGEILEHEEKA